MNRRIHTMLAWHAERNHSEEIRALARQMLDAIQAEATQPADWAEEDERADHFVPVYGVSPAHLSQDILTTPQQRARYLEGIIRPEQQAQMSRPTGWQVFWATIRDGALIFAVFGILLWVF